MDTVLPQKFPFILDRNLAKANCTENQGCTSCDTVVVENNTQYAFNWINIVCVINFVLQKLFLQLDRARHV